MTVSTLTPNSTSVLSLLGDDASTLLEHKCGTIDKSALTLPGPDFVDRGVGKG